MANQTISVEKYINSYSYTVSGYLKKTDAHLIRTLGQIQTADGVSGGLAEIGVHHGKLMFILALLRAPGEKILAMDLFEDDGMNAGVHAGRDTAFFANIKRLGVTVDPEEILKGNSLELKPADILDRIGAVRLFSIDGGHLYHHVENDCALALDCLHEQGVIIIDDFCSVRWPEVTFATHDFLRDSRDALAPFLLSKNKLYVCRRAAVAHYRAALRKAPLKRTRTETVAMMGDEVTLVSPAAPEMLLDEAKVRAPFLRFL